MNALDRLLALKAELDAIDQQRAAKLAEIQVAEREVRASIDEIIHRGPLTKRELEIVELIGDHLSNKQIARRLHVSLNTVKNHVHNILEKLRVKSRWAAVEEMRRDIIHRET